MGNCSNKPQGTDEAELFIASVGEQVSEYKEELADHKVALDDIKQQIMDKQTRCKEYELKLDKILSAKKLVKMEVEARWN